MPAYLSSLDAGTNKPGVNVEAWTEETIETLRTVRISSVISSSPRTARASAPLEISLDQVNAVVHSDNGVGAETSATARTTYVRRCEPLRRDSMKSREALLKGKEGSRRRQKWENGW